MRSEAVALPQALTEVKIYDGGIGWEEFFSAFRRWAPEKQARMIRRLTQFGPADEVCEAVCRMPTFCLADQLYHRAVCRGVRFNREDLEQMGYGASKEPVGFARLLEGVKKWWNYY